MNRVTLTGKIVKPPRRSYRPDGSLVVEFPLELSDPEGTVPAGDRGLIVVVAFGDLATSQCDRLETGQQVEVEGGLKQRQWKTPEGKRRTRTEVIATHLRRVEGPS